MSERGDGPGAATVDAPGPGAGGARRTGAGPGGPAEPRNRVFAPVAAALAIAVWGIGVLHVGGLVHDPPIDPLALTISDYVLVPGGHLVLVIAAGALALAGGLLTVAAGRAGAPRAAVVGLGSWTVTMVVAGIVPTNAPGTPSDLFADVHRYAGAWVFAGLPVVVLLLGPAVREGSRRRLRVLAVLAALAGGAFLLSHVPIVVAGSPAFPLLGGVERVLYGVVILLLLATAAGLRPARSAGRPVGAPAPSAGLPAGAPADLPTAPVPHGTVPLASPPTGAPS